MNRIQVQHVVLSSRWLKRNPKLAFSETVQNCPELVPNHVMRTHRRRGAALSDQRKHHDGRFARGHLQRGVRRE